MKRKKNSLKESTYNMSRHFLNVLSQTCVKSFCCGKIERSKKYWWSKNNPENIKIVMYGQSVLEGWDEEKMREKNNGREREVTTVFHWILVLPFLTRSIESKVQDSRTKLVPHSQR
jgi:hypothetical protein